MHIDAVSKKIILLALYLDKNTPGLVPEIWIDSSTKDAIKKNLPNENEIEEFIADTDHSIQELQDSRRKQYLSEILSSVKFQIYKLNRKIPFSDFSEQVYGYRIERVTTSEIDVIEQELSILEKEEGKSRFNLLRDFKIEENQCQAEFVKNIEKVKKRLPDFITDFPDKGFHVEITTGKPWTAYNHHTAPFTSTLMLNRDAGFTSIDLYRLASHESYGGHHSELSHKDRLLVEQGKGEHGVVIMFSPQVFISEAIAEGMYVLLGLRGTTDGPLLISWLYDRLMFALQNLATYLFFEDKKSREEIDTLLRKYGITDKSRKNILNFSTDPLLGKYAPIYYSAYNFINNLFNKTQKREVLLKTLFTLPCTPGLLLEEFGQ